MRDPVAGDVDAAAHPHAVVLLDVVEEALQRAEAAGAAEQAAVHADRHHRRALVALGVHHVEGVLQVLEELVAVREALRQREAHVVGVEGVALVFP